MNDTCQCHQSKTEESPTRQNVLKNRLFGFLEALSFGAAYLLSTVLSSVLFTLIALVRTVFEFYSNRMSTESDLFAERFGELLSSELIETVLISNFLVLFFVWLILWCRKQKMSDYVGFKPARGIGLVGSVVAGVSLNFAVGCLLEQLPIPVEMMQEYTEGMEELLGGSVFVVLMTAALVAPFVEEVLFRGALLRAFRKAFGVPLAVIASSLLFAFVHIGPIQITYAFLIGVVLCVVRLRSGSLWCTIAMHIAFNAANYIPLEMSLYENPVVLGATFALFVASCALACVKEKRL